MLINDKKYCARVRALAKRQRESNRRILRAERDLRDAKRDDLKISADVRRLADDYGLELYAAANEACEFDRDAYELAWQDVDAEAERLED